MDKLGRWLGCVQGCLTSQGRLSVQEELDFGQSLFHEAYLGVGKDIPPTLDPATKDAR